MLNNLEFLKLIYISIKLLQNDELGFYLYLKHRYL